MIKADWPIVSKIYNEGITTGIATFETAVPPYGDWHRAHLEYCRFVALIDSTVIGWAALSPVSSRCVYCGVAEVSIYVGRNSHGMGVGTALLKTLIMESENRGLWTLQAGIFPENQASIKLHEKMGFRFLGRRERIGKTGDGVWKDNLLFERRSKIVGI